MVLQDSSNPAPPDWLTVAILFSWPLLLSSSTVRYQFIWYICTVAAIIFFSLRFTALKLFIALFLFRYVRLIVNLIAFCFYKPVAIPNRPGLTTRDVTVIVPTVQPDGEDFKACIESILANGPAKIIVVTAGPGNHARAVSSTAEYSRILIKHCHVQNKRIQVCEAIPEVHTPITVLCDDHVFWPENFLPCILAPFEDPEIGCVGTNKRVRRTVSKFPFASKIPFAGFWNFIGCLYLERHNFEIAATNTIDGGVFVVSGRTAAYRTAILEDESFRTGFINEYIFFGQVGPLNADDDNFITRWIVDHDWKIKIQYSEDACIQTTLGEHPKFLKQCERWARTTWRSNPRSLLSDRNWKLHKWCIYSVYLTSLVNFALFYDAALLYTLWASNLPIGTTKRLLTLSLWILCSKLVKPFPHLWRNPSDLVHIPCYILFGYYHSFIKLYALFTFRDIAWGSRPLNNAEEGLPEVVNGGAGGDAA